MSLIIPNHYRTVKIMAIDPGLNNTGVAVYEVDSVSRAILSIEATTLVNTRLPDRTGLDDEWHQERTIKLYKLKHGVARVLSQVNPCLVVCESPFYNRFHPSAYGPLLEVVSIIQSAMIENNTNTPLFMLAPKSAKKLIGSGMDTGKLDVKAAVMRHPDIMAALKQDINLLDEHSIDAIAIGYGHLKLSAL